VLLLFSYIEEGVNGVNCLVYNGGFFAIVTV